MSDAGGPVEAAIDVIDVMARVILASGIEDSEWENYPDIGEHDWERIIERASELAHGPSTEAFSKAYVLLTARARSGRGGSVTPRAALHSPAHVVGRVS